MTSEKIFNGNTTNSAHRRALVAFPLFLFRDLAALNRDDGGHQGKNLWERTQRGGLFGLWAELNQSVIWAAELCIKALCTLLIFVEMHSWIWGMSLESVSRDERSVCCLFHVKRPEVLFSWSGNGESSSVKLTRVSVVRIAGQAMSTRHVCRNSKIEQKLVFDFAASVRPHLKN